MTVDLRQTAQFQRRNSSTLVMFVRREPVRWSCNNREDSYEFIVRCGERWSNLNRTVNIDKSHPPPTPSEWFDLPRNRLIAALTKWHRFSVDDSWWLSPQARIVIIRSKRFSAKRNNSAHHPRPSPSFFVNYRQIFQLFPQRFISMKIFEQILAYPAFACQLADNNDAIRERNEI